MARRIFIAEFTGNSLPSSLLLPEARGGVSRMAVVLVVEDEDQVRVLAESYLQEQGHRTFSASTVNEALAVLDEAENVDLLFTDIGLKGELEAGLDLAKQAVTRRPGLKVLYTTDQGITDGMTALFVEK